MEPWLTVPGGERIAAQPVGCRAAVGGTAQTRRVMVPAGPPDHSTNGLHPGRRLRGVFALIETLFGLNTTLNQPAARINHRTHRHRPAAHYRFRRRRQGAGTVLRSRALGPALAAWLMAALLHAVWNTLSLAGALINLRSSGTIGWLAWLTTSGLVALAAGCLVYLITQTQAWRLNDQRIY